MTLAQLQHAGEFRLLKSGLHGFALSTPSCQPLNRVSSSRLFLIEVFVRSTSLLFQQLSKLVGILLSVNIPNKSFFGSVSQL